jgi:cytochrome c-type biogenesis protein CcmH/NrfF
MSVVLLDPPFVYCEHLLWVFKIPLVLLFKEALLAYGAQSIRRRLMGIKL